MEPEEAFSVMESGQQDNLQPETLLKEFRERSEALDGRLDTLQELIEMIRGELHEGAQQSLSRLAAAADDMANGRVFQQIDIQAKGELGALVASINATLMNLQQLDTSVKHQSTQVPELAAQLDAITADTETATQNVMNRLDSLMAASDQASARGQGRRQGHAGIPGRPGRLPDARWTTSSPAPGRAPIPPSWPRRSWNSCSPSR